MDFGKEARIVKSAPLPVVEAAGGEVTEGSDAEDVEEEEGGKEKKKRVGFRDRKVG